MTTRDSTINTDQGAISEKMILSRRRERRGDRVVGEPVVAELVEVSNRDQIALQE